MTQNERILKSINKVLSRKLKVETRPYFCLKVVRQIIEDANDWPSHEFYRKHHTHWVEENKKHVEPWARDLQRSLRKQGLQVPFHERKAGDLVFMWKAAFPYGHVGVLIEIGGEANFIFENSPAERGFERGNLRISHFREIRWGMEFYRLPELGDGGDGKD